MDIGPIPVKLMDTVLLSLAKDKKGKMTDQNNYRPIAITCVTSKILEQLFLDRYGNFLTTNCHQFGFKKQRSTDLGIFVMKEIINYYNSASTPVYACYIDASKAFDKINHWMLLCKLLDRNVPKFIRLFMVWFSTRMRRPSLFAGVTLFRLALRLQMVSDKVAFCLLCSSMFMLRT